MAIDDNKNYVLSGSQIKDLPGKVNAVKGLAKELTSADYNWPAADPNGVAMWLLPDGTYVDKSALGAVYPDRSSSRQKIGVFIKYTNSDSIATILYYRADGSSWRYWSASSATGDRRGFGRITPEVIDNLTSTSTTAALSAAQGKALKGLIDAITSFSYEVVQTLPASGQNGKIYLVPIDESGGPADNIYEEYIWVDNAWEMIGTTEMDLTNYVQFSDLATVATSGSYADLSNKPTIPSVVQSTGTSTTDVMSQNAVTSMVFADPGTKEKVQIGGGNHGTAGSSSTAVGNATTANAGFAIALGNASTASASRSLAVGNAATAAYDNSVAIGSNAATSVAGEVNIGAGTSGRGYNSSNYRLLTGVYDPQNAHDAATKGYVDGNIPATFTTNEWNALWA